MTEIFKFCDNATHNLRIGQIPERRSNRTNNFRVESVSTLDAKIRALVPENLRQSTSFKSFEQDIKKKESGTQITVLVDSVRLTCKIWVSFN